MDHCVNPFWVLGFEKPRNLLKTLESGISIYVLLMRSSQVLTKEDIKSKDFQMKIKWNKDLFKYCTKPTNSLVTCHTEKIPHSK